ncbi:MAG: phosphoribosylanthranilate isomerase [Cyanobacteriota bacterium]
MSAPLLKICGLRSPSQAAAVAQLGVDALGVIAVPGSPRYLAAAERPALFAAMRAAAPDCQGVLVVADPGDDQLAALDPGRGHQLIQLHGRETPERCAFLRQQLGCGVWKAVRLRQPSDLLGLDAYGGAVDALLLDAWVPDQLGGTGHAIPLEWLAGWSPPLPWWLAGGITAERAPAVLRRLHPTGLDASSGVEQAPGDKDLERVRALVAAVQSAPVAAGED